MSGNGSIKIGRKSSSDEQKIDLSIIEGDIALSTESVKSLKDVTVMGKRVVTVENLTSFHDYPAKDDFVVYLGGFRFVHCIWIRRHFRNITGTESH